MIDVDEHIKIDPKVKDILLLLAGGTFLAASFIMPGLPLVLKPFLNNQRQREDKEWAMYNTWRLRQIIKRLNEQKMVEIKDGEVKITKKGRQKLLKYDLEKIELKKRIDGKWRLIIYDISNMKKPQREIFRATLKRLRFLQLQKSVYLTPYVCDDEIEFIRQTFNIGSDVILLKVKSIENEKAYKDYFGIN